MLAVTGDMEKLPQLISHLTHIKVANWNSRQQVVLAGSKSEISKAQELLTKDSYSCTLLNVSGAFHTSFVGYAQKPFAQAVKTVKFHQPKIPVFSNVTGNVYPENPELIGQTLAEHMLNPVLFKQEIENIYAAGGYCFVEFGPRQVVTNLVKNILGDRPHLAVALNPHGGSKSANPGKDSDRLLREAVVQLRVSGLLLKQLDPYQVGEKVPDINTKKSLTFKLNGNNYVSDKTKAAFEEALQNSQKIDLKIQAQQQPQGSSAGSNGNL